jgi:hypothetical protein
VRVRVRRYAFVGQYTKWASGSIAEGSMHGSVSDHQSSALPCRFSRVLRPAEGKPETDGLGNSEGGVDSIAWMPLDNMSHFNGTTLTENGSLHAQMCSLGFVEM